VVAKVEFYDFISDEDDVRDGAAPLACVLLDHVPRAGDEVWLKPFGRYIVKSVEFEIDTNRFSTGVRDISVSLRRDTTT
jgi:hypothetical protein